MAWGLPSFVRGTAYHEVTFVIKLSIELMVHTLSQGVRYVPRVHGRWLFYLSADCLITLGALMEGIV